MDIYVANDGDPNQLWINQKNGTFKNEALLAGAAVNRDGQAEAGMGVDAGDFNGDGTEDIFITHLMEETNTLYVNLGGGAFEDRTREAGLGLAGQPADGLRHAVFRLRQRRAAGPARGQRGCPHPAASWRAKATLIPWASPTSSFITKGGQNSWKSPGRAARPSAC